MKRIGLAVCLVFLIASGGLFAGSSMTGVGIYGNLVGSGTGQFGSGLGLTLKFGQFPVLGAEWMFGNPGMISVSCDYWVINAHLGGALDYYLGIGGFVGFATGGQGSAFSFGARLPIGLQIWPVEKFEIFAEVAPLVYFVPTLSLAVNIRLGMRIHF